MTFSPILALMKEVGAPLTRDEYLKFNNLGKKSKVTPEEEVELPSRFQYPVVSHEELPEVKPAASGTKGKTSKTPIKHFNGKVFKGTSEGAPVDFPGRVLPNPTGIKPMMDTDHEAVQPSSVKMDISNPSKNQIEPDPLVPREQ